MDNRNTSFGKSIAILEMLAASGEMLDVKHIARELGLAPGTVRSMLGEMVAAGFVDQHETMAIYSVGKNALHFSSLLRQRFPIERIARPVMRRISLATGETSALNIYLPENQQVICTAIEESQTPLQYVVRVGEQCGLLDGAGGRAISAFLSPELESMARDTEMSKQLEADWKHCRQQGYVLSRDTPGAVCLGAPVFSDENRAVASVVITIPEHRYQSSAETLLAKILLEHVAEISFMLGHSHALQSAA